MDSIQKQTYYPQHHPYLQQLPQSEKCMEKQHPSALKELLQKPPVQCNSKTSLSPNGTFKYIKRQNTKAYHNSYSFLKPPIFTSQDRIRRPLNCFMVYSHLERKKVAEQHPELHNADLSKILGKRWKTLTPLQKQPYIDEAERIRQLHTEIYPDYKYQPRRKNQMKRSDGKFEDNSAMEQAVNDLSDNVLCSSKEIEETKNEENGKEEQWKDIRRGSSVTSMSTILSSENSLQSHQTKPQKFHQIQNSSFHQLTPVASPYFTTQDSGYNQDSGYSQNYNDRQVLNDIVINDPLKSFPPTPEVSPIMLNREESVFAFDLPHYVPPALQQQGQNAMNMNVQGNLRHHTNNLTVPCQLQQQHINDQLCYPQDYYQVNPMNYYYRDNGTSYNHGYTHHINPQQQQQQQRGNNLSKNEMNNNLNNILDSLQNH